MHTFSDSSGVYSVDMLIIWVKEYKPKTKIVNMEYVEHVLPFRTWNDGKEDYSAIHVMINPKKYPDDMKRIREAQLKYPILMCKGNVLDGFHRIARSYLNNKKTIKVIDVPETVLKKVKLAKNHKELDSLGVHDIMALYLERFQKKAKKPSSRVAKNPSQKK
jgi:hypothetical protein